MSAAAPSWTLSQLARARAWSAVQSCTSSRAKAQHALGKRGREAVSADGCRRPTASALANSACADAFAATVLPVIDALGREEKASCNAIARALNQAGVTTTRGQSWNGAAVRALLRRCGRGPLELCAPMCPDARP